MGLRIGALPKGNQIPVIACLTTVPERFEHLSKLVSVIDKQTLRPDLVVINIPHKYAHFNITYNQTKHLEEFQMAKPSKFKVFRNSQDWGPGTKLLGCLEYLN